MRKRYSNPVKVLVASNPRDARADLVALCLALLAAVLALALTATVAWAHAGLVRSDPENGAVLEGSPEQVVAWFSQELDSGLSSMRVFDAQGGQVDKGDGGVDLNDLDHKSMIVSLPSSLPVGSYTVRWTVVSAEDEDATEGEFAFAIGNASISEAAVSTTSSTSPGLLIGGFGMALALCLVALFILFRRRQSVQEGA